MDRNSGRYNSYVRRHGQQQNQVNNHYSTSSSSSSLSSNSNNHSFDNHRNNSSSSSTTTNSNATLSTQFSTSNLTYSSQLMSREPATQHDELIRYITEAWTKINEQGSQVYHCNESDQQLKNFKPFNLGEFWGQRLVQKLRITSGNQ